MQSNNLNSMLLSSVLYQRTISDYWVFGWLIGSFWLGICDGVYQLYSLFYVFLSSDRQNTRQVYKAGVAECSAKFLKEYYY